MTLYMHVSTFVYVCFLVTPLVCVILGKLRETLIFQNVLTPIVLNLWPSLTGGNSNLDLASQYEL